MVDALFDMPDVDSVRRRVELAKTLQSEPVGPDIVLVVAGYLSPEFLPRLGDVHRVIVATAYDDEELTGLVGGLKMSASESAIADTVVLRQRLAEVQESLGELETARARDAGQLLEQVRELTQTREPGSVARLDAAIREWQDEEKSIRTGINIARQARQEAELGEMEQARAHAQLRRRIYLLVAVPVALALYTANAAIPGFRLSHIASGLLAAALVLAGTGILGLFPLFDSGIYRPKVARKIAKPVKSIGELDRLALTYDKSYGIVHKTHAHMGGVIMSDSLTSRNPHIRYAAAASSTVRLESLGDALSKEATAIVRRRLIQRIVTDYNKDGLAVVLKNLGLDPAVTAAFDFIRQVEVKLDPRFRVLAVLYGWKLSENTRDLLEQFIKSVNSNDRGQKPQKDARQQAVSNLARAYQSDRAEDLLPALSINSGHEFRVAAAKLSPFEVGKLGTYDWLRKIDEIDEMYLFFRKCQFYVERGVAVPAS